MVGGSGQSRVQVRERLDQGRTQGNRSGGCEGSGEPIFPLEIVAGE